jgi:hypothetical protein
MLPCRRCGDPIEVGWKTKRSPLHLACGIANALDNNAQLAAHSGPMYDQWLASMREYAVRQGWTTAPSMENLFPSDHGDLSRSNGYASSQVRVRTPFHA